MKARFLLATASLLIANMGDITPSVAQGLLPETEQSLAGLPHVPKYRAFLPPKVDLSADFPPAGYQGELGTCVGWAVGYSLRSYMAHRSTGVDLKQEANRFNPLFVYNSVSTDCMTGAALTAGMSFISKQGALPFSSDSSLQCSPGRAAPARLSEAASYRIGAVKLIPIQDIDTIKGELAHDNPVVFSMNITKSFRSLKGDAVYHGPQSGETGIGHAMVMVGYDDSRQAFKVINSWGPSWADHGFGWIGYPAFTSQAITALSEAPVTAYPERLAQPDPAPLPVPVVEHVLVVPPSPPPLPLPPLPDADHTPMPAPTKPVALHQPTLILPPASQEEKLQPAPKPAPIALITPPQQPSLRDRVHSLQSQLACARLEVNSAGAVHGFVSTATDLSRVRSDIGDAASAVQLSPWPQCEVQQTLAAQLSRQDGLTMALAPSPTSCPAGSLCNGDPLVLKLQTPTLPAYLYVVYLQASGDALVLRQPTSLTKAPERSASAITLGDAASGLDMHVSGPDFGGEMAIALASASPLFDQALPNQMSERDFLSTLRKALLYKPNSADPDRVVAAAVLPITTRAQ